MLETNQPVKSFFADPTWWLLLFSNISAIFFALVQHWELTTIMWVYWFQSVTIGFFNFIRILQLKEFSTQGFQINNRPASPTPFTKYYTAFFFLVHFGFFHFVYAMYLLGRATGGTHVSSLGNQSLKYIFLTGLIFFANHLVSYIYYHPRDTKKQNIGTLMFYPYVRIIPMHLTIIFGAEFSDALILFLVLKTFADLIMHAIEHSVLRKGEEQSLPNEI